MPVKVRCPSCDKLLSAPDSAAGKLIKCPGCQTKLRVPASDAPLPGARQAAVGAGARKEAGSETLDVIANLDFSKAADSSVSLCPKCGADIPEGATECPQCGVDPATGQLTEAAKKRASRKGPDPALYYSAAWKDSWAFVKTNKSIVFRTTLYGVLTYSLAGFCLFMVIWCKNLPPKAFWLGLAVLAGLIYPGWLWHLNVETIKATMRRKNELRGVHFDMFQNISLGITNYFWSTIFSPLYIAMPLAMVHMAMPVSKLAWKPWSMLPIFFRTIGPTLYWWVIHFSLNAFLIVSLVAGGLLGGSTIYALVRGEQKLSQAALWTSVGIGATVAVIGLLIYSLTSLFEYRAMGLLGYYFKDKLDLVTEVEEKVYVRKEIQRDLYGNPIKSRKEKTMGLVIPIVMVIVITVVGYYIYSQMFGSPSETPAPAE